MHILSRNIPLRDILLVLIGAFSALSLVAINDLGPGLRARFTKDQSLTGIDDDGYYNDWFLNEERPPVFPLKGSGDKLWMPLRSSNSSSSRARLLPKTRVLNHAPGWTMFENLYMSNGTLFIVADKHEEPYEWDSDRESVEGWEKGFPPRRMMTSTGLWGYATAESIREREPTDRDMSFISPEEAAQKWNDRVWEIEGHTWLYNDPNQFMYHFYHYVAESLFGFWAFHAGTLDPAISPRGETTAPPPDRAIFIRCDPADIRDYSNMNSLYMNAAFPSISLETKSNWKDRVFMTRNGDKAWVFSNVILADRSASFRGRECGSRNQRIAAEALKAVEERTTRWWWEPIRRAVLRFASVPEEVIDMPITSNASFESLVPVEERRQWPIVITYINRQGGRRHLIEAHHERLVHELSSLAERRGWEFNDIRAEMLSQEEQLALAARTTVLVGVHGNGLSHLISMPPTKLSTVVEIFWPTGFMYDYQWTARTLRHQHFAVWNDTALVYPDLPIAHTPEGFQSDQIPVHAPFVAQLIERGLDAALSSLD